jgi:hypothetical protein
MIFLFPTHFLKIRSHRFLEPRPDSPKFHPLSRKRPRFRFKAPGNVPLPNRATYPYLTKARIPSQFFPKDPQNIFLQSDIQETKNSQKHFFFCFQRSGSVEHESGEPQPGSQETHAQPKQQFTAQQTNFPHKHLFKNNKTHFKAI